MSSSRCKLVSSLSSRGASAGSGQRSGRPRLQHPSLSQRNLYSEAQEQNARLRALNATLRNQNMDLAKELNEVRSMLRISRQNERELERRRFQQEASIAASARGRRSVITRSHSTDARPRRAAQRNSLGERGEPQGGCGARAGVNKEPRGAKISQTRQSRGDSSNPSTRGEDSNSFVDKNADRSPLGTSQAWLGSTALVRPVAVVAPIMPPPPPRSPNANEVHRIPQEAPALRKGRRRCSIVPYSANVNLQSSQQSATRATSALAGPAAERISATQIQRTPDRGSSQFLNDTESNHKTSPTTPTLVAYESCSTDTRSDILQHAAAEADNSYYRHPPDRLISASGYSQAVTGTASPSQLMSASDNSQTATGATSSSELILASGYSQAASAAASSSQPTSTNGYAHSTAEGAISRVKGRETGDLQARPGYFGAASFDTPRSDRGQDHVARVPSASSSQPTSIEETPHLSTSSRPRRGVARPLSYQEPSLSSKMRNYRGHVMFPTAKARTARSKSPDGAASTIEKENGGGSKDYNGGRKKT